VYHDLKKKVDVWKELLYRINVLSAKRIEGGKDDSKI